MTFLSPPVLSQCPRGWKTADLPVGNLLSLHSTSHLLVAEGVGTGSRHPQVLVGLLCDFGQLIKGEFSHSQNEKCGVYNIRLMKSYERVASLSTVSGTC